MSNVDDYKQKLEEIQAIPDDEIKSPSSIPVDVYLQEAENLYHWCRNDKEELTAKGLDWELVMDVPVRCGAVRSARLNRGGLQQGSAMRMLKSSGLRILRWLMT